MLELKDLDPDQIAAVDYCFENDYTFLISTMGGGKTIIALTAIEELMVQGDIERVLVLAPLKVCNKTWRGEHEKWAHTKDLHVQVMTGDDRVFDPSADIVVVNFDLLPWLAEQDMFKHFDGLVVDESTKLKAGGAHFKAIRRHIQNFKWRLVMTGTPVTENYVQLFYQMFLVDGGETFGRNKQTWLDDHFYTTDYQRRNWVPIPGREAWLAKQIVPYVYTVPDYRDSLPPLTVGRVDTPLPPSARLAYKEMAGKMKTAGVLAKNAAVKSMKLTQIANGFIYDDDKKTIHVHDAKSDKLAEIVEKIGKMGVENILVIYQFIAELEQLREQYPDLTVMDRAGGAVDDWNAGEIPLLAMHPKSGGHGLNMSAGGHNIIWLSPPWSRDLLDQVNARLWRRGQTRAVDVKILTAPDTIDDLILARLDSKAAFMPEFMAHLAKMAAQDAA